MMQNQFTRDSARWRFDEIASPQQSTSTRGSTETWAPRVHQAYSFVPHDAATAVGRLLELRAALQRASLAGERGAADWKRYVDWLLDRAEAARRDSLARAEASEREFRLREARDARTTVDGLRVPHPAQ